MLHRISCSRIQTLFQAAACSVKIQTPVSQSLQASASFYLGVQNSALTSPVSGSPFPFLPCIPLKRSRLWHQGSPSTLNSHLSEVTKTPEATGAFPSLGQPLASLTKPQNQAPSSASQCLVQNPTTQSSLGTSDFL